jgi:uncharacterized protein YndB with AHSA1/START domain
MGDWWLKTHSLTKSGAKTVVIEPFSGGRWYEIGRDGEECNWGQVLVFDRPGRLVLAWQLNGDWVFDPDLLTEVEVVFTAVSETETQVDFEHRLIENFGAAAERTRGILDAEGGWTGLLAVYGAFAGRG